MSNLRLKDHTWDAANVYDSALGKTQEQINAEVGTSLAVKQATLVSGENIKTVNGASILGSGNIEIQGGGGSSVVVDDTLSIAGAAADAKKTGDDLGSLKSAYNDNLLPAIYSPSLILGSYYRFDNGSATDSNKYARAGLWRGFGPRKAISLDDPTYEFSLSFYDETGTASGTGYLGHTEYSTGIQYIPKTASKFGVGFRRVDRAVLTNDDITAISEALSALATTDKTLSIEGAPADSEVTGIAINNSGVYFSDDTNSLIGTYDALIAKYDELCAMYPQYITKNTLTSGDYTNYEYVLTIGNYNSQNGHRGQDAEIVKPTILISSGVHGRERSAVMGLYGIVKAMCENVGSLKKIIYAAKYRIIPIACPSGYTNDTRVNNNGVNINRNFATENWTLSPTGDDYSGAAPADQPETKLMQTWIENHNDALLYIDWHNSRYSNEISCLLGINTTETAKWKKKYLTSLNSIIPWWMKHRNIPPSNIYAYTGGPTAGYSNPGTAVTYAREHNIETAFVVETAWDVLDSGKHSKFSIGVGQEAFANMLIGFADLINDSII